MLHYSAHRGPLWPSVQIQARLQQIRYLVISVIGPGSLCLVSQCARTNQDSARPCRMTLRVAPAVLQNNWNLAPISTGQSKTGYQLLYIQELLAWISRGLQALFSDKNGSF